MTAAVRTAMPYRARGVALAAAALSLWMVLLAAAPATRALPTDPFAPHFSVCTDASPCTVRIGVPDEVVSLPPYRDVTAAGTTRAGAHPDLTLVMRREISHCVDPPFAATCTDPDSLYIEQDLKRLALHLPRGLMGDVNAAPYCEAYRPWVPVPSSVPPTEQPTWLCRNPDSVVGRVDIIAATCGHSFGFPPSADNPGCLMDEGEFPPWRLGAGPQVADSGLVLNERPRPGEQGHLVILWPQHNLLPDGYAVRTDVSIRVRAGDAGLDSVADDIPDTITKAYEPPGADGKGPLVLNRKGAQISDLVMTLWGATGADRGHPLLTNPTFCDPQSFDAEFQGWAYNSVDYDFDARLSKDLALREPAGEGKVVQDSAPYRATGCEQVPYNPRLDLTLEDVGPGQAPAIRGVVTQGPGEATTGRAKITFPAAFKINSQNTAKHCSAEDLAAKTCLEESRIGTVTASSPLLPLGEEERGGVYLAGLTGDSIKMEAQLHGFVDLTIKAEGRLAAGTLELVNEFKDLPTVPVSGFDLRLEGGAKGIIKTPKTCGPQTVKSLFVSHSGKEVSQDLPVDIRCNRGPDLEASFSPPKAGSLGELELSLDGRGHRLQSVDFGIARQLGWGIAGKASTAKRKPRSAGSLSFETAKGTLTTALRASAARKGIRLAPLGRSASELAALGGGLSRAGKRRLGSGRQGARKRPPAQRPSELRLFGLPRDDPSALTLKLKSKRGAFFVRAPRGCADPLNFTALVTTTEGRRFAVSDSVRLRGRDCPMGIHAGRRS